MKNYISHVRPSLILNDESNLIQTIASNGILYVQQRVENTAGKVNKSADAQFFISLQCSGRFIHQGHLFNFV